MALLTWGDKYSVGVREFDKQHQRLVEMINALHDAMSVGKGKDVLGTILEELIQYTANHFAAEERFMHSYRFQGYAAHKAEHEKLTTKVLDFQKDFAAGKIGVTVILMGFLRDWLTHHILESDKKYAVCLQTQPVSR
jgi:hemerythrin